MIFYFNIAIVIFFLKISCINSENNEERDYYKEGYFGIIKSCKGCALGHMTNTKRFLIDELFNYPIDVIYDKGDPYFFVIDDLGNEIISHKLPDDKDEMIRIFSRYGYNKFK